MQAAMLQPSLFPIDTSHASEAGYNVGRSGSDDLDRKQRSHEYRVAARREKRNRKADEKKQRKLNATILRRMTRNPEKYNKNAERNRLRAIELERRSIQNQAVRQAQRLAALHDPTGKLFNVEPVLTLEDGTVITEAASRRRAERLLQKESTAQEGPKSSSSVPSSKEDLTQSANHQEPLINADRQAQLVRENPTVFRSKTQEKKLAKFAPRPTPPKPVIPDSVKLFDGEENWLSLWDLTDAELDRRVKRAKKQKAAGRKALRLKQQSGKAERRMARDERRRVYRDLKSEWKELKEETKVEKLRLQVMEEEEVKKIAVHVCDTERQRALACCSEFGVTMQNTAGIDEIVPKAMGMKGVEVDFTLLEKGKGPNEVEVKSRPQRIDLSAIPVHDKAQYVSGASTKSSMGSDDFIHFDIGDGQEFQQLRFNHKVRRKLRRALDLAETKKEQLVREKATRLLEQQGQRIPEILHTPIRPAANKGHRILPSGKIETQKMERVRSRMALLEFNNRMRVLRKQAKETAILAGLRKHAEATGRILLSE